MPAAHTYVSCPTGVVFSDLRKKPCRSELSASAALVLRCTYIVMTILYITETRLSLSFWKSIFFGFTQAGCRQLGLGLCFLLLHKYNRDLDTATGGLISAARTAAHIL